MNLLYLFDLLGVMVFAISGSLCAGRKSLDIFGVVLISLVTALGGGTLRDLLIGNTPVLWIRDPIYLWAGIVASLGTVLLLRGYRLRLCWLLYADAFGLAIFTAIGVQVAVAKGVDPLIAVLMGVMTGTFGGLLRDVLTNEIPLLLQKEIYALAAMAGAIIYLLVSFMGFGDAAALWVSVLTTLVVRLLAIRFHLSLPLFQFGSDQ